MTQANNPLARTGNMRWVWLVICLLCWVPASNAQARPFVEGSIDNLSPYIGEPVIYTLKLYSQNVVQDGTIIEPSFFGFGRSTIILEPVRYTDSLDGMPYNIIEQSYIIYPLRDGDLTIDPFQIEIPETPFDPSWTILSDALTISVRPYPEPMPETFINGVGQFDIVSSAAPTTVQSGDALTLSITISGTGNLEQLIAPEISVPDSWRIFPGQTSYQQDSLRFGSKTFEWTLIVNGSEVPVIPAIAYSYLNPQSGRYESQTTAPISLQIAPVTPVPEVTIERPEPVIEATIVAPPLLTIADGQTTIPAQLPVWFWWLWFIPPVVASSVWGVRLIQASQNSRPARSSRRIRNGSKSAIGRLRQALQLLSTDDPHNAYQAIPPLIDEYLSAKFVNISTQDSREALLEQLPEKLRDALSECLEEASSGQYAPLTAQDVQQLKQRVLRICQAIEKATRS